MTEQTAPPDPERPPSSRATTTPTASAVGIVVDGRYRIVKPLAAGGMGSVYLGEQDNLHRQVAIKLIRQPTPEDVERFRREAEALAAVSHPAVVEVYDYVEAADQVSYLVMAYVAGEDMADHVAARPGGRLPLLEALELLLPIASAMVELHAHGILHRDLKPANLVRWVRADGRAAVKLVDFGIARRQEDPGLTAEGLIVGTPSYLAPEVILGKKHSAASDAYSFGATLYELIAGEPPHGRDDLHQILKRAIQDEFRPPPELAGTALGGLLGRMLAREEDRRPTMQAVLEELEQIRLALLMEGGSAEAALVATRALSQPPEQPKPATARTVALSPKAGIKEPETAMVGQTAAPDPRARRASPVPWIVTGVAIAAAVTFLVLFLVRTPEERGSSPASGPTRADATRQPDARPAENATRPTRSSPKTSAKPAGAMDPRQPAGQVAEILKQCTDRSKAYKLFSKANFWYRMKQRLAWVQAAFEALLACPHTSLGQRRWVLYRLALLHARAGACKEAETTWKKYEQVARKLGIPKAHPPPCTPRK